MAANLFQTIQQAVPGNPNILPDKEFGQYPNLNTVVGKGSLISFRYIFVKPGPNHNPTPVVLVTDVWNRYIRGVNINYLTFPIVKGLLQPNCSNPGFSYGNIKGNNYITSAFRQYKREGIRELRKLDCAFLLRVLATVRSFDPSELEAIRRSVREQIQRVTNPAAQATSSNISTG